eukprot:CAMPEP_0173175330 /NCGR_PEP_ID=MMETSP1141-20130122/3858_1 /TAXON_ID=483371 /ORGANISM="non described non described, Strain CCMP2298" /LENGTH=258 /DNA_ID=CAMNT_0014097573 /DNA_START=83 /DNA_END=855 /DNA_ORIENTATION=+
MESKEADEGKAKPEADPLEAEGKRKRSMPNPIKMYQEHRTRLRLERERMLLLREERMREDLERFLMESEDRSVWVVVQLNSLNHIRMKKKAVLMRIRRTQAEKEEKERLESLKENGLSFFKGGVRGYKKWQNSAAKHLDFLGHSGSISAVKLSPCGGYILSCSEDKTAILWDVYGEQLRTFVGHGKIVNDCGIHASFDRYTKLPCLLTCSGDGTLRLWNTIDTNAQVVIKGHTQAVYRCAFSPHGRAIVSCSEDRTIR